MQISMNPGHHRAKFLVLPHLPPGRKKISPSGRQPVHIYVVIKGDGPGPGSEPWDGLGGPGSVLPGGLKNLGS